MIFKIQFLLVLLIIATSTNAQLLSNIKSWWKSYGNDQDKTYQSYTETSTKYSNVPSSNSQNSSNKVSVVKYGEWTSAPVNNKYPATAIYPAFTMILSVCRTERAGLSKVFVDNFVPWKASVDLCSRSPSFSTTIFYALGHAFGVGQ